MPKFRVVTKSVTTGATLCAFTNYFTTENGLWAGGLVVDMLKMLSCGTKYAILKPVCLQTNLLQEFQRKRRGYQYCARQF